MIADQDRSGWFGASDTSYIMGKWTTKTFANWWMQKLGLDHSHITTVHMIAGTYWEHSILSYVGAAEMDKQIIIPDLRLRVNLDGNTGGHVNEVKTHKFENPYKPTRSHIRQCNVEMFAMREFGYEDVSSEIDAYGLMDYDYRNFFGDIDPNRLHRFEIEYDNEFIQQYLKRLLYLRDCLLKGEWPNENAV